MTSDRVLALVGVVLGLLFASLSGCARMPAHLDGAAVDIQRGSSPEEVNPPYEDDDPSTWYTT